MQRADTHHDSNFVSAEMIAEFAEELPEDTIFTYEFETSDKKYSVDCKKIMIAHTARLNELENVARIGGATTRRTHYFERFNRRDNRVPPADSKKGLEEVKKDIKRIDYASMRNDLDVINELINHKSEKLQKEIMLMREYATEAKEYLRQCIEKAIPLPEALNMCKQKYEEDCIVETASIMLAREISQASRLAQEKQELIDANIALNLLKQDYTQQLQVKDEMIKELMKQIEPLTKEK